MWQKKYKGETYEQKSKKYHLFNGCNVFITLWHAFI